MVALYGAARRHALRAAARPTAGAPTSFVRGVWRDYARQYGAIVIAAADFRRLTGDERINDLALWLAPGADTGRGARPACARRRAQSGYDGGLLEFAAPRQIRAASLRIFDRSFAVTYWLQAVAIAIGLFGIAASFSAQVLARRKEFGLLAHLGLTRRQVLAVVAGEGALWTAAGAALGLVLGHGGRVVLVDVVNPQSFHWTMELARRGRGWRCCAPRWSPPARVTAWLAARAAVAAAGGAGGEGRRVGRTPRGAARRRSSVLPRCSRMIL